MERSKKAFEEALRFIPGGVNSPVRAFKAVGGSPVFIERGSGSKIYDIDGNEYIDYVLSWGPMIVGHAHPDVSSALKRAVDKGTSFGAPTEPEVALAMMINRIYPSMGWSGWSIRVQRRPCLLSGLPGDTQGGYKS